MEDIFSRINSIAFYSTFPIPRIGGKSKNNFGYAKLWLISSDGTRTTCLATLTHSSSVRCVEFHPTASILATCGNKSFYL